MSQERKSIKYFSFVAFAAFVIRTAMVVIGINTSALLTAEGTLTIAVNAAAAIVNLACSVFGIRGANRPSAIDPLRVTTLCGALVGAVSLVLTFAMGAGFSTSIPMSAADGVIEVVFFVLYLRLTNEVMRQREKI